jgi:hypothetical protein
MSLLSPRTIRELREQFGLVTRDSIREAAMLLETGVQVGIPEFCLGFEIFVGPTLLK